MHGATWSIIGAIVSRGLSLLSSVLVARVLGRDRFGEIGIILGTVLLFQAFASFGLTVTSTKHVAELRATDPARAGRVIALSSAIAAAVGALFTVGVWAMAPALAVRLLAAPHLAPYIRAAAPQLLLGALNAAQVGSLSGLEAYRAIARVNVVSGAIGFPLVVAGAWGWGVPGAVWGNTAALAVSWAAHGYALRSAARTARVSVGLTGWRSDLGMLLHFSLPGVIASVLVTSATWVATAVLVNQPGGYGEMGLYSAATRVKQIPEILLGLVLSPLLPVLSDTFARRDLPGFTRVLRAAYAASAAVVVPSAVLLAAAPDTILAPFGAQFLGNPAVVQWLGLQLLVWGLFYPPLTVLASTGRMWAALAYHAGWTSIFGVAVGSLVPRFGAAGLAAALVIAYAIANPVLVLLIRTRRPELVSGVPLARFAAAGVASILTAFGVARFHSPATTFATVVALSLANLALVLRSVPEIRAYAADPKRGRFLTGR